jgi:ribonuclease G
MLRELEEDTGKIFHFEGSEGLPLDHMAITFEGSRAEVEERALPFGKGEEVLVQIVEPHMYNVDDAVAKIDGYIISVTGGGAHVGEKRLVRIEEVGRTAATAVLVGDPEPAGEDSSEDGALESGSRRRGRRGGRRRSRAKAEVSE